MTSLINPVKTTLILSKRAFFAKEMPHFLYQRWAKVNEANVLSEECLPRAEYTPERKEVILSILKVL